MPPGQPSLFELNPAPLFPDGFGYQEDAITAAHESALLDHFRTLPFKEFQFRGFEGKRRVVSFGWRYDFNEHKTFAADPIPAFLTDLYATIRQTTGFTLDNLDQVLVTEYSPGAAIGWHKDRPVFNHVAGLSLASPCTLRLRKPTGHRWQRVSLTANPRSAYFFEGPARWEWEHSIPSVEELRYSVTFRDLR